MSADADNTLLGSRGLLPGTLVRQVDATSLSDLGLIGFDFQPTSVHPLLSGFRGSEDSGLAAPYVRRFWELELDDGRAAEVVLAFAGTDLPAVVSHRLGEGRVVTLTTAAADPEWSIFPLASNFAAFVHDLLGNAIGTAGGGSAWQNLAAGDRLVVPASAGLPAGTTPQLIGDDLTVRLDRRTDDDGTFAWTSVPIDVPGVYELAAGDVRLPVVVNRPAVESDPTPAGDARLREVFGESVQLRDLDADTVSTLAAQADRPDWGWSLLLLALVLALGEAAYASFLGRRRG